MQRDSASHQGVPRLSTSARTKLLVSLGAAIVGGAAAAAVGAGRSAPLIGWDILAVVFCAWVWSTVWRLDAKSTASHAQRENPGRDLADVILLGAAVASLIAVGVVLFGAGHANGNLKYLQAGFALVSVSVSWTLVHTVFTLKYARLYYSGRAGLPRRRRQRDRHDLTTVDRPRSTRARVVLQARDPLTLIPSAPVQHGRARNPDPARNRCVRRTVRGQQDDPRALGQTRPTRRRTRQPGQPLPIPITKQQSSSRTIRHASSSQQINRKSTNYTRH
jgi:uncharacterized membrane protein